MKCNGRGLSNGWLSIVIIALILVIDQLLKIEVKTSLSLGSAVKVTDWFYIEFVENNGMAYGMTFFNKLVLSVFRKARTFKGISGVPFHGSGRGCR